MKTLMIWFDGRKEGRKEGRKDMSGVRVIKIHRAVCTYMYLGSTWGLYRYSGDRDGNTGWVGGLMGVCHSTLKSVVCIGRRNDKETRVSIRHTRYPTTLANFKGKWCAPIATADFNWQCSSCIYIDSAVNYLLIGTFFLSISWLFNVKFGHGRLF